MTELTNRQMETIDVLEAETVDYILLVTPLDEEDMRIFELSKDIMDTVASYLERNKIMTEIEFYPYTEE